MKEIIANRTWNNFHWPEWVPDDIKEQIMGFHSDSFGRGPASWIECAIRNKAPLFGARVRLQDFSGNIATGLYIHAWNNIGRLLDDDGVIRYVGCSDFEVSRDGMWQKPASDDFCSAENTERIGLTMLSRQMSERQEINDEKDGN